MTHLRGVCVILCVSALAVAAGCSSNSSGAKRRELRPADFAHAPTAAAAAADPTLVAPTQSPEPTPAAPVATPAPAAPVPSPAANSEPAPAAGNGGLQETSAAEVDDAPVQRQLESMPKPVITAANLNPNDLTTYTVDAMVGQVNGQALYASSVFQPVDAQLTALGKTLPPGLFQERARNLILARLDQIVADALILGEAERDLSEQEQFGLKNYLKDKREELLRFWGERSQSLADVRLRERTGKGLDQTLSDERQKVIVQRYLRQKLYPKINITRKDIERYYNDPRHREEFNSPTARTLRLIRVSDESAAGRIEQMLADKKPFVEVASLRLNQYRPEQGGLMSEKAVGDSVFGEESLNQAMKTLTVGQHSPRLKVGTSNWWIYLDAITPGKNKSLRDSQVQIEELLRRQRFQALTQRYRQQLFAAGSYNPVDQMADSLVAVAISRYAVVTQ